MVRRWPSPEGQRKNSYLFSAADASRLPALLGLVLGLAGAAAVSRLMPSVLFDVSLLNAVTFIGVALGVSAVTLAASDVLARRAVRRDPIAALRQECYRSADASR